MQSLHPRRFHAANIIVLGVATFVVALIWGLTGQPAPAFAAGPTTGPTVKVTPPAQTPTVRPPITPVPSRSPAVTPTPVPSPVAEPLPPVVRVPILMYHYIRVNPDPDDDAGYNLSVTQWDFADQMEYLAGQGFQTVTLAQLVAYFHENRPLPDNPIILTFDDGYADFYTEAYPVLRQYHFTATVFVITGLIDNWRYLKTEQIQELSASGVEFGGHTTHHVDLRGLDGAGVETEIYDSKVTLDALLGRPSLAFCYPGGGYNYWAMSLVEEAGYQAAVTTRPGQWHMAGDLLALRRVRISGGMGVPGLAAQLAAP
jgi:peptidoglycan/xylan/chitin deacetylase (PgdA/CDA1 family)